MNVLGSLACPSWGRKPDLFKEEPYWIVQNRLLLGEAQATGSVPPGSNRSSGGGNKAAEAFDVRGREDDSASYSGLNAALQTQVGENSRMGRRQFRETRGANPNFLELQMLRNPHMKPTRKRIDPTIAFPSADSCQTDQDNSDRRCYRTKCFTSADIRAQRGSQDEE
jgi:hypothetical protein